MATNNWEEIIHLFNQHEGTIISFCRLHNINVRQFYYYRKKFAKKQELSFHPISIKKDTSKLEESTEFGGISNPIKIELGKAIIHVPHSFDKDTLSTIITVLYESC